MAKEDIDKLKERYYYHEKQMKIIREKVMKLESKIGWQNNGKE